VTSLTPESKGTLSHHEERSAKQKNDAGLLLAARSTGGCSGKRRKRKTFRRKGTGRLRVRSGRKKKKEAKGGEDSQYYSKRKAGEGRGGKCRIKLEDVGNGDKKRGRKKGEEKPVLEFRLIHRNVGRKAEKVTKKTPSS